MVPHIMQHSDSGSNGVDDRLQQNTTEAMIQWMMRRNTMSSSTEGGFSSTGMLQGGGELGQFSSQGANASYQNQMNQEAMSDVRDMYNDGSAGLQVFQGLQGNLLASMVGHGENSNQSFPGSDMSQLRGGMQQQSDGSIEDELLGLLIQRRNSIRSGASSGPNIGQFYNQIPVTGDPTTIQSLTDELLRVYAQNRALLAQQLNESSPEQRLPSQSFGGGGAMGQHDCSISSGSNNLVISSIGPQDIHRLADTSGIASHHTEAYERIDPVPLSMHDYAMRQHFGRRDQQQQLLQTERLKRQMMESRHSLGALGTTDDLKRRFLESRRSLGGLAMGEDGDTDETPRKRRKTNRRKPVDMPRRPLSAYNLFFSEERERILTEIQEKEASAAKSEEAFLDELGLKTERDGGEEDEDVEAAEEKWSNCRSSDEGSPKVTCNALLRPIIPAHAERRPHRKTHGKISFQSLAQLVGKRWRNLDPERKQYYQKLADEDMKRQRAAMEEYYKNRDGKSSPGRLSVGSASPEEKGSSEGEVSSEDGGLAIKEEESSTEGAPMVDAKKSAQIGADSATDAEPSTTMPDEVEVSAQAEESTERGAFIGEKEPTINCASDEFDVSPVEV